MWNVRQQRITFMMAMVLAIAAPALGQQNTQSSQQGNQQPATKPNFWDKIKSATNKAQNVQQQGTQQVQQGMQQVQQGTQQVQQGVPQSATGALQGVMGGASGNGSTGNSNFGAASGGSGACGGGCFNAGPFGAAISQMILSQEGNYHIIRMNIQVRNLSDQPVVLAYRAGSNVIVDNLGNAYYSNPSNAVTGMGTDWAGNLDPQFALGPGQSRNITMQLFRVKVAAAPVAATYNYDVAIDAIDPNDHTKVLSQYSLDFPGLAPGSNSTSTATLNSSGTGNNYTGSSAGTIGNNASTGTLAAPVAGSASTAVSPSGATGTPAVGTNAQGQTQMRSAGTATPAGRMNAQTQVRGTGSATPATRTNAQAPAPAAAAAPTPATSVKTAGLRTNTPPPAAAKPAPVAAAKPTPAKPPVKTPPPAHTTTSGGK